ncbi:Kef-type potassium/proton antiporter (CPA2 family) [Prosthecobacter fusiformis]|uniref:Kef-type potassium/proton antiporter (CPA2 family) n=1 Tax=Prosthecobacter fusiformis TaxID=48464 RepID=A0A4R7SP38_9BACT|nr:monovalent cation:proton antiporter-2 (CPA2) family protein [Prosthecobacter fusiformis]TDU80741.1 Kef-type potassium/proton antiporter (CPA2 family) [Prosthecobacter fusiformis]
MSSEFLFQAVVYLLAAVIAVPIAKRLGLGSVLGYLLAGIVIGPSLLGLVGEVEDVQHVAEFGVVIMLFVVGLELRPSLLWRLRGPILGMGSAQVLCTAAVVTGVGMLLGLAWPMAVTIGLILSMSSTAIVIQSLAERNLLNTRGGQACFSVLLFQDIAVIPMLAVFPWLAHTLHGKAAAGDAAAHGHESALAHLPQWAQTMCTIGAVVGVIVVAHYFLRYLFRYVAASKLREMFTVVTLLVVAGVAWLMHLVGLSAALGTFIAGVVLAESEYRHQLEADVEPFKGLLLGLFFMAVGAGLNLGLVMAQSGMIAMMVAGLIGIKFLVLLALGGTFRLGMGASFVFACAMAQGGEFCFVLLGTAGQLGLVEPEIAALLNASVAISMALTPLMLIANDRLIQPRFARMKPAREHDVVESHEHPVILAGFGRFGHIIGRLLQSNGFGVTVLDNDPDQVEMLARFGLKSFYGDASRADLLAAAGAEKAKLFVCAVDEEAKSLEIVDLVRHEFPHLRILARATSRDHAYQLIQRGVTDFRRDLLGSSLDLSTDILRALGFRAHRAVRAVEIFRCYEEQSVRDLAKHYGGDQATYVSVARQHLENLEAVFRQDLRRQHLDREDAWDVAGPKES